MNNYGSIWVKVKLIIYNEYYHTCCVMSVRLLYMQEIIKYLLHTAHKAIYQVQYAGKCGQYDINLQM